MDKDEMTMESIIFGLKCELAEKDKEIERLTEERDLYKNQFNELEPRFFDLRYEKDELQKQVDELTEDRNKQRKLYVKEFAEHANHLGEFEKIKQQAVKDTAKEICEIAVDLYDGESIDGTWFFGALKERYGVEVE